MRWAEKKPAYMTPSEFLQQYGDSYKSEAYEPVLGPSGAYTFPYMAQFDGCGWSRAYSLYWRALWYAETHRRTLSLIITSIDGRRNYIENIVIEQAMRILHVTAVVDAKHSELFFPNKSRALFIDPRCKRQGLMPNFILADGLRNRADYELFMPMVCSADPGTLESWLIHMPSEVFADLGGYRYTT